MDLFSVTCLNLKGIIVISIAISSKSLRTEIGFLFTLWSASSPNLFSIIIIIVFLIFRVWKMEKRYKK